MKNTLQYGMLLFALSIGTGAAANAQATDATPAPAAQGPHGQFHGGRRGAMNPEKQTKMLTHKLGLTEQQAQAVEPILASRDSQVKSLFASAQSGTADRSALRQQMKSIRESTDLQLAKIFTGPQEQIYEQMKEHRGRGHRGSPNGAPEPTSAL